MSVCGKPFDSANINERIQHSMETRENSFAKKDIVKSSGVLAAFALVFYYLQLAGMIIGGLVQLFYFFMFLFNGKGLFAFLSFLGLAFIIATGLVFMYMWSHVRAFFLGINTLYYNEIKDHQ